MGRQEEGGVGLDGGVVEETSAGFSSVKRKKKTEVVQDYITEDARDFTLEPALLCGLPLQRR